jgi:hypothetical protein
VVTVTSTTLAMVLTVRYIASVSADRDATSTRRRRRRGPVLRARGSLDSPALVAGGSAPRTPAAV